MWLVISKALTNVLAVHVTLQKHRTDHLSISLQYLTPVLANIMI